MSSLGTIGVVGIRLATRPAGDGVLEVVENFDVYVICRAVERKQLAKPPVVIVILGEFFNRLIRHLAQPHNGTAYELVVPVARSHLPRL